MEKKRNEDQKGLHRNLIIARKFRRKHEMKKAFFFLVGVVVVVALIVCFRL